MPLKKEMQKHLRRADELEVRLFELEQEKKALKARFSARQSTGNLEGGGKALGVSAKFVKAVLQAEYSKGMTTWELKQRYVMPLTSAAKCTVVDLFKDDPELVGPSTVFVSHAYGCAMTTCSLLSVVAWLEYM